MLDLKQAEELLWQIDGVVSVELVNESPPILRVEFVAESNREIAAIIFDDLGGLVVRTLAPCVLAVSEPEE
jgi:hypothetical protein